MGVPKVKLPLLLPQVAFIVVVVIAVGPGVIVRVGEIVNVQPRLLVSVIIGEPAPKPLIVWPNTIPEVLVIDEIETEFVGVTLTMPLLKLQVALVTENVAAGLGLMVTIFVVVLKQIPEVTV